MAALSSGSDNVSPSPARPLRAARLIVRVFCLIALAFGLGFIWFLWRVPDNEVELDRSAEGIVVLTGGASRIPDAIELLASGRGKRLLISGVNRTTSPAEIAKLTPRFEHMFTCCVDLDHSALNTVGNAVETRRWVDIHNFRSLIVVTSNYHMPRAMAELAHELPDVTLIAYPVVTEKARTETLLSRGGTAKLLVSEYLKYIIAMIRMNAAPAATSGNSRRAS